MVQAGQSEAGLELAADTAEVLFSLTQDIVGYFAKQMKAHGRTITPESMCYFTDAYVAKDRAEAIKEYSPFYLYFVHTLWHHGSLEKASQAKGTGYLSSSSYDYIKPENRVGAGVDREGMMKTTPADIERKIDSGELSWGSRPNAWCTRRRS